MSGKITENRIDTKTCGCGCGKVIMWNRRFVRGHNTRMNDKSSSIFRRRGAPKAECEEDGCTTEIYCHKKCVKHYGRWYRKQQKLKRQQEIQLARLQLQSR